MKIKEKILKYQKDVSQIMEENPDEYGDEFDSDFSEDEEAKQEEGEKE
jgi:hypothetical protein